MKIQILFSFFFLPAFFAQSINAQEAENKEKRKMTVITKSVAKDGKTTTTTVVKEGDEMSDEEMDKIIEEALEKGNEIDVKVETVDGIEGKGKIIIKEKGENGVQKKYTIIKKTQEIEVESDGEHEIIHLDKDHGNEKIKEIKVIKKKSADGKNIEITIGSKDGKEDKMIWLEKEDGEDGDIIIIEEETMEEKGEDGKTIKKTVKKKKKIVKKEKVEK